ncbi:MAG: glycosyltransferase, partial [Selenomonadaceae bacterium]|nr:glycosyltransferase [Selenomonadaceae bacterium]
TAKNTGSPGDPSNLGVDLSRGEYLLILDHDDAITPDALEKLYVSAKTFNADVVTCEYFYLVPEKSWNDAEFRKNLKPHSYKEGDFVSEPTLMPFDVAERVRSCYEREFLWPLWSKFIRREFLIESKIRFTNNIIQDFLATCCMIYTARRFLRVPYVVNLWRMRDASLSNQKREPLKKFQKYLRALTVGIEYLDGFLSGIEFFQKNPEQRNIALKTYAREVMKYYVQGIYKDVPLSERYETLRKEFAGSSNAALTEVCFNTVADSANNVEINKANSEIIDKFKNYFTARVDIQRRVKAGDFQIVSVSDDKADVRKPTWINKDGIGYQIQSYAGKMDIVAKSTNDGQIKLILRGLDIKDAKDKSKRIPYRIDYTKFTVNGKVIFDKLTSTWHDEPYRYNMNVKADEEVKIQVEWLPHNGDAPTIAPPKVSPIDDKFLPFITGRLDIQLKPQGKGDFQIASVSDDKADVRKPDWLQKDGIGYQIQSYAGKMELVAKATNDGQIKLILRGLDIKDAKDKSKRIPYWIDYTKLIVNGKIIFNKVLPVWHDEPYRYNMNVKADEEIKIQVEWLPHRSDA